MVIQNQEEACLVFISNENEKFLKYKNKDLMMSFGMAKDDRFEIIAIIREELLKKTKLEIVYKNNSIVTQLEKVDFEHFAISHHEDIVTEKIQGFILHSDAGIIKFNARFDRESSDDNAGGLVYFIPDMIFFVQRR